MKKIIVMCMALTVLLSACAQSSKCERLTYDNCIEADSIPFPLQENILYIVGDWTFIINSDVFGGYVLTVDVLGCPEHRCQRTYPFESMGKIHGFLEEIIK